MARDPERIVLLLRAINVGGHNRLPMAELREVLDAAGFGEPHTILASGNAFVTTARTARDAERHAATAITEATGLDIDVIARTAADIRRIVAGNPYADDMTDDRHVHVMFFQEAPAASAWDDVRRSDYIPEGFEVAGAEMYIHYANGAGRSRLHQRLSRVDPGTPGTARNWRTVERIAAELS